MKTPYGRPPNEGAALIVVLALLVLITVAVLIELAVSNSQRTTSDNAASGAESELLARTAASLVIGQLVQEVHDGTATTPGTTPTSLITYFGRLINSGSPAVTTYQPPYTNSYTMRMAVSGVAAALLSATTNLPLVKESTRSAAFYSGTNYFFTGVTWASPASTATPSANGRSISSLRWNRPLLLPLKTTGSTTDFSPTNTYVVPDWIYLTRGGPKVLATTDLPVASSPASSNTNYVIGRFAFNVYDEGGLLDVSATGNHSSSDVSTVDKARKGTLALADLTQIPNGTGTTTLTQTQANALVAWRNASSYNQSGTSGYTSYLFNKAPVTGYMQPAAGDESFTSRQDLLAFWQARISSSVDGLRFFTTFSRTLNAPAWFPKENAFDLQEAPNNNGNVDLTPPSLSYAYRANANATASFNRNLLGVRVKASFTRLDGTTANIGDPLIKTRFDLNRLSWITYNGVPPAGVTATDIYNYFGLTWAPGSVDPTTQTSTGAWVYNHGWSAVSGDSADIMTLDQVAALTQGRDPDYFELLKAGILRGSLGLFSGDTTNPTLYDKGGEIYRMTYPNFSKPSQAVSSPTVRTDLDGNLVNEMEKYQVIQIGANIISQYSSDNYPTPIQLNGNDTAGLPLIFSGVKNLPYFNTVSERTFRPPAGSTITPNTNQGYIHAWVVFSLWNPHMNAGTASGSGPGTLRILVRTGTLIPKVAFGGVNSSPSHANISVQGRDFSASPCWIQFVLSDYATGFADPTELTTANSPHATVSDVLNEIPATGDATTDYNDLALYVGWNQSLDEMLAPNDVGLGLASPPGRTFDGTSISLLPTTTITPSSGTVYKPFSMELQYADPSGNWHTYQVMPGVVLNGAQHGSPFLEPKDPLWTNYPLSTNNEAAWAGTNNPWQGTIPVPRGVADIEFGYLDPRTTRIPPCEVANPPLSTNGTSPGLSDYSPPIATRFYSFATKGSFNNLLPENAYGQHFVVGFWNWWDDNLPVSSATGVFSASGNSYTDRDYIRRLGDSAGYAWSSTFTTNVTTWTGLDPLMPLPPFEPGTGGQAYRPIMLSRPFHSVGELGYAFRDLPWKTLDFFSNKSADAPLLDLFCLGPGSSTTPEAPTPSVVAGTVNINSAPVEVLTSLLSGAGKTLDPANSDNFTATLSVADAQTIAKAYIAYIQSTGPLVTPADLPRVLPQVALYNGANSPTKATASSAYPGLKTSRETPIRALAGATSTRTWNVLIDVVAQSGRFLPTATTLDQFSDKGERRYWIHVAIDRFTGKVIDQKVEFVPQ